MARPKKDVLPKDFVPQTAADFERILRAEGMPAELAPIETKHLCSPGTPLYPEPEVEDDSDLDLGESGDELAQVSAEAWPSRLNFRARFPELQEEIVRVHLDRQAADQIYARATDILWSGDLSPDEFKVWEQFCEGHGWPAISKAAGFTKHKVNALLAAIKKRFGLKFKA